jgi:hypothetical protein
MPRKTKNLFHQRKKGEPITYDGSIEPIPFPLGSREGPSALTIKITASPEDWQTLFLLVEADPEHLGKLIKFYIATPIYEDFLTREGANLPRGRHEAGEKLFMDKARRYAAAAYTVISHWATGPITTWPEYLQALIREAEKTSGKLNVWPPGKKSPDVIAMVRCLIALKYGEKIEELGLANTEYMDNEVFRNIYLDNDHLKAANKFMEKYGDVLTIDLLYDILPVFPWVPLEE